MPPLVGVAVVFVPPLAIDNVPATSAVPKSTALVLEPEPTKIEEVSVFETIASVTDEAGSERAPLERVKPFEAVSNPEEVTAPAVTVPAKEAPPDRSM